MTCHFSLVSLSDTVRDNAVQYGARASFCLMRSNYELLHSVNFFRYTGYKVKIAAVNLARSHWLHDTAVTTLVDSVKKCF